MRVVDRETDTQLREMGVRVVDRETDTQLREMGVGVVDRHTTERDGCGSCRQTHN